MGYIFAFLGGVLVGIICTTVCLCKKNLEAYTNISNTTGNAFKQNLEVAKALYNAEINGTAEEVSEEVSDETAEENTDDDTADIA